MSSDTSVRVSFHFIGCISSVVDLTDNLDSRVESDKHRVCASWLASYFKGPICAAKSHKRCCISGGLDCTLRFVLSELGSYSDILVIFITGGKNVVGR